MKRLFVKSLFAALSALSLATLSLTANALQLTPQQMANVTLSTATVATREAAATITVNGTLRADQRRLFRVSPVVDGLVTELNVVVQTTVRKGQVLARLHSTTLGQAQTDYLEALARYDVARADYRRIKGLSDDGVVAKSRLIAAESQYKMADAVLDQRHRELSLAGMNRAQIKRLAKHPDDIAGYALLSPADGMLLEVAVESGQMLAAGELAFRLADLSVVWADVQIPVARIGDVALGSHAAIRVAAYPQQRFGGRLEALSGEVEVSSQTLAGRVVIDNQQGLLRPGMYVQAELQGAAHAGLMVPASALFRRGNDNYVFIVSGPRSFSPTKVSTGQPTGGWIELKSGVSAGAVVVSGGVAELKSHWQYQGGE
ncbi:MAG: efflux RND transporter periplasmic adaptor subunit [Gammaproteobacteria bacterium]|nr:efflux RND transporter periplasmic adaptor subunit [Gammaproteobacteria bacterium]